MKQATLPCMAIIGGVATILAAGCSPTGWAVREVPDGSDLQSGENVTVIQRDGSKITGEYVGTTTIPWSTYSSHYQVMTQPGFEERALPAIGQTVQFALAINEMKCWTGQLVGFDLEYMWTMFPGKPEPEPIYFTSITSLSGAYGGVIGRMRLRDLFVNGDIPLRSALKFKNGAGEVCVPISSIKELVVRDDATLSNTTISGNDLRAAYFQQ